MQYNRALYVIGPLDLRCPPFHLDISLDGWFLRAVPLT